MLRALQRFPRKAPGQIRTLTISSVAHQTENKTGSKELNDAVTKIISSVGKKKRKEVLAELRGSVDIKPLSQIKGECDERFYKRYIKTSVDWQHSVKREIEHSNNKKLGNKRKFLELFENKLAKSPDVLKISDFFLPLNLGDVVELSTTLNQSGLAVVVQLPSNQDPRYTLMNRLGELHFVEKSAFKFRIPRLIPEDRLSNVVYKVMDKGVEDYGSIKMESDGFSKYAVNPFARSFIVKPILNITLKSWNMLQETSRKLEIVHRLIQHDLGPKEVSIFTLVQAVHNLNMTSFRKGIKDLNIDQAYSDLRTHLIETVGDDFSVDHQLGRNVSRISADETFDLATFYSVILSLRKQTRLWNSSYNSKATLFPLTVTALPLHYTHRLNNIAETVENNKKTIEYFHEFVSTELANDLSNRTVKIPPELSEIFFLLREYAVGNIKDNKLETLVALLMKEHHPSQDITKSIVYNFLIRFQLMDSVFVNPTHYSTHLSLPNRGVSQKSDMEQKLYSAIDQFAEDFEHDLAENRTDFSSLKVFCIDSENAHEIDDGISLEKLNDKGDFKIYVHIADPASFIKKDSSLFRIAYDRAFTIYQPEMVSTMLPNKISQIAGLGINGQKTRAITFSMPFNIKDKKLDFTKCKVEASYVSQFPKGYYYSKVDQILNEKSDTSAETDNCNVEILKDMFKVAQTLRDERIKTGGVVFGESIGVQIRVNEETGKLDDFNISQQSVTKSNTLVSEFMILANRIAGEFMTKENIAGVYKTMKELPLGSSTGSITKELNQLSINSEENPRLPDIVKLFKFISASSYSSTGTQHFMLGCENYAPSTSPLRRFGDMINHYQYHSYLNSKGKNMMFDKDEVLAMSLHIESKNDIIKRNSSLANSFYMISHFKSLIERKSLRSLDIIVNSKVANGGSVFGILRKFGIFVTLKYHLGRTPPNLGDVITVELGDDGEYNVQFVEFDAVGNSVVIKEL